MDIIFRALRRCTHGANAVSGSAFRTLSKTYNYEQILVASNSLQHTWDGKLVRKPSQEHGPRVACLADSGPGFAIAQWATWMNGGIFVPLATNHPSQALQHSILDAGVAMIFVERQYLSRIDRFANESGIRIRVIEDIIDTENLTSDVSTIDVDKVIHQWPNYLNDGALILYTSGTTGEPKGVLHTHSSLGAQMESLSKAWEWRKDDVILHALPMYHIHGLVNAFMTAHYNGACVHTMPTFNARHVWRALQKGETSVFMGVPTMYSHMLSVYGKLGADEQARCLAAAQDLRLTVCGSSACPLPVMRAWEQLAGSTLLERYGMTEVGMALSNPYNGPRMPGTVGLPLPGVEAKIMRPQDPELGNSCTGSGELLIRSPMMFKEYWNRDLETAHAIDENGFFLTGDTADQVYESKESYFRILGRTSVDIIKSGGYKISALKIENKLLEHPAIREVIVLGLPDDVYGQTIVCICTLTAESKLDSLELMNWASDKLPPYEIPRNVLVLEEIPRNAMGKVNKKQMRELYERHQRVVKEI